MRHGFATAALVTVAAAVCVTSAATGAQSTAGPPHSHASSTAALQARLDRLDAEVTAGEDILAIKRLQRAYGYYVDKGMWEDVADLFTQDAVANYPAGVFVGWKSIREHLYMNVGGKKLGELGLGNGRIYNHMNIQPVIHLDPGGKTARGRWRALAMFGNYPGFAVWAEGVYEIHYRKDHGVWKIQKLDYYDGFGAPYQTGWGAAASSGAPAAGAAGSRGTARPGGPGASGGSGAAAPRTSGGSGTMARVRRVFRHLAHPPDRPRDHSCDGFPKACIAPFDYTNPGTTAAGADVWTVSASAIAAARDAHRHAGDVQRRAAKLVHRAMLLRDAQEVEKLQRIYGFYLDRAMWDQVADLFADDATMEMGQRGVYVGKSHIRQFLNLLGHDGLTYGWLNDHIQLQPIVDVAPDGKTARLRSRELDMMGVFGKSGTWSEGTYENTFVMQNGVWKFKSLHYYPTFISAYDKGWGGDAEPAPGESSKLPPDRPPTEVYAIYPKAFVPPFHYRNPATGEPPHYPTVGAPSREAIAETLMPAGRRWVAPRASDVQASLADAQRTIDRVKDYDEIENLESSYGYYLDKDLWTDLSNLFADNGTMELAQRGVYIGRDHIHTFLLKGLGRGHEGPSPNMLGNHMQLQPVIDVSADGRTAHMRVYMLQQMAFGSRASIGAAVYENEAVKVDGIWKFARDHAYNTLGASYAGGWVRSARPQVPGENKTYPPDAPPSAKVAMFPDVYDIPFHYSNPVTGRNSVPTPWQDGESSVTQARATALYAPLFPKEPYPSVSLTRDVRYGPDERNVLDIFTAPDAGRGTAPDRGVPPDNGRGTRGSAARRPVVVFVHGGGFSHGTNHMPGTPFYDNVGLWAASHGLIGVTMTYRLAPKFQFPAGVEDVTAAVRWLRGHIATYGGDPREIFLWGHSAGAAHVADYVAHLARTGARPVIAGAILTSGVSYDLGKSVSIWKDYYGSDIAKYPERSSLAGLVRTSTPLLVTDAELDPPLMHEQTDELIRALRDAGKPVPLVDVPNHSHLSELYAVGTADQSLSGPVLEFIRKVAAKSRRG